MNGTAKGNFAFSKHAPRHLQLVCLLAYVYVMSMKLDRQLPLNSYYAKNMKTANVLFPTNIEKYLVKAFENKIFAVKSI